MPHPLILAAGAVLALAAYRGIAESRRRFLAERARERERAVAAARGIDLDRDPTTGVYRPRSDTDRHPG